MSKKFQKINLTTPQADERLIQIDFSSVKKDFVIVDAKFTDGKTFFNTAQNWIEHTDGQQTLYYLCLLPQGFAFKACDQFPLSQALASQWPPLLPGLHKIALPYSNIQLIVGFGEPEYLLKSLLWFGEFSIEKSLRNWSVDAWFLDENLDKALVTQFSHENTSYDLSLPVTSKKHTSVTAMPWAFPRYSLDNSDELIIIGAGLAGCYLAHLMANHGWKVTVLEALDKPALMGSGNAYSVLYPKLSLHHAPFTELLHLCYPFAYQIWKDYLDANPTLGRTLPLWQQADEFHQAMGDFLQGSSDWFSQAVEYGQLGLLFHKSLIMDMPGLCEKLLKHPNITCHYGVSIEALSYENNTWQAGDFKAPICVLANSYKALQFSQAAYLGVKGMRGQMTHTQAFHEQEKVYCQQGHFLPQWRGIHALGASFVANDLSLEANAVDDEKNLCSWRTFFNRDLQASGSWVGIRGVSLDHLPIVGPLCDAKAFNEDFSIWRHHANDKLPHLMPNVPGLYAFTGFGARGLMTIPRLADCLKSLIENKPTFLPTSIMQAISPARFLRKKLIKGLQF